MAERNDEMVAEVSLKENAVYKVKDGKLEKLDTPPKGYGKQTVFWQDGKPGNVEIWYTCK